MIPTRTRLTLPVDVAYGSLSLFTTILHNVFLLYHVDMFVSVYKINKSAFWIGEVVFLVWNSLNDPVFGWISDNKYLNANKGTYSVSSIVLRRLQALKWTGPLFTLSFLAFWVQWTYPGLQFVVCLCLYDGFLTMIDLHHSALLADISVSADTRTKLNSRSSLFSIVGSGSVFISYAVWNKDNLHYFRVFCLILSVISFIGFWIMINVLQMTFKKNMEEEARETDNPDK